MSDSRATVEFRLPATELAAGDLVNTSPGEDDWQEVVGVFRDPDDADENEELRALIAEVAPRYVVVQLTDLAPVDGGVFFADGTTAMIYGEDGENHPVGDIVSEQDGVRTYLYTRYELVVSRTAGG